MAVWRWLVLLACDAAAVLQAPLLAAPFEAQCAVSVVPRLLGHSPRPRLFVIGASRWLGALLPRLPANTEVNLVTEYDHTLSLRMTREAALVLVSTLRTHGHFGPARPTALGRSVCTAKQASVRPRWGQMPK